MRKLKSAGDTTREPGGRSSAGTSVEPHSVLDLSGASHLLVRCSRAGRSTRVERQVGAHSAEHAEHAEHARGIRGAQSVDRAVDACGEPTMMPALFDLRYECLLYTSDAADDLTRVDLGGRRMLKKK